MSVDNATARELLRYGEQALAVVSEQAKDPEDVEAALAACLDEALSRLADALGEKRADPGSLRREIQKMRESTRDKVLNRSDFQRESTASEADSVPSRKIVIGPDVAGFCLSREAWKRVRHRIPEQEREIIEKTGRSDRIGVPPQWLDRSDPELVQAVEDLGSQSASGDPHRRLVIVEIPADVDWHIVEDEDGSEWIAEQHRTWDLRDGYVPEG